MASPLISYAVTLHQSTDYREKQYKVFQYVAKLLALQPGMDPRVGKVAATLSQSRGIFKIFKWVTCLEDYQKADGEKQVWLRRVKKFEAALNAVVTMMQDTINVDKLFGTKSVSTRFAWWMSFLDLLLSLLLASIAAYAIRALQASGDASDKAKRKLLLLRLELGVRLGDAVTLLREVSKTPAGRKLWQAPSPSIAILGSVVGASCATAAVMLKKADAMPGSTKQLGPPKSRNIGSREGSRVVDLSDNGSIDTERPKAV